MIDLPVLQSALFSPAQEFFNHNAQTQKLCNGSVNSTEFLPIHLSVLLEKKLLVDQSAHRGFKKLGIETHEGKVVKYYECNYSAFDSNPDICVEGNLGPVEYVPCLRRGVCDGENLICKNPNGLSNREMQVAKRISLGQQDMQISMELFISQETLRNHKNSIETKIGKKGKPSIAAWYVRATTPI